jgi:hypothetical protein
VHRNKKLQAKLRQLKVQQNKRRPVASPKPLKLMQKAAVTRLKKLIRVSQQKPSETI